METGPDVMRRYRKLRDSMSQDKLAKRAGLTTGAISQIERAVDRPRRETAERIDEALDADGEVLAAFGYINRSDEPAWLQGFRAQALAEMDRQADQLEAVRAGVRADVEVLHDDVAVLHDAVLDLRRRLEALEQRGRESV